MAETKITKKGAFTRLKEIVEVAKIAESEKEMLIAKLDNEISLLDKKNAKSAKSKTQVENDSIKKTIVEVIARIGNPVTVSDLMKEEELKSLSNQKLTALVHQLKDSEVLERKFDKRKAYFSIATPTEEVEEEE